jgi:2-polyprenyl-3-methyl-5-hydroxy-6-metoxy-1,4-benzoquinol methylase
MNKRIHYTNCPVCGSATINNVLQVKDYTVSHAQFSIVECSNCTLRFTQDVPDQASIAPYYKSEDYISHTNTQNGVINRLYHFVRQRTIERKRKLICSVTGLAKGRMLDVGCGTGSFLVEMKGHGWQAIGLEPDADARAVAKQQYGLDLQEADQLYQLPAGQFDAITLWHVMEHVHDLQAYVQQLKNLLSEEGKLFIAVPNYTSGDAAAYKQYWAAYDVPRHLYHFSPSSVEVLMQMNGLKVEQYKPMWYDSFYISLLSSKYKNGNTNWIGAAWTGLSSNLKAMGNVKKCSSVIYIISR